MNQTDVLISGGGIGGAVLAALLVREGKRVTIVERAKGPPPFLRPELLWPAAIRTLESIRPLEFWERECLKRAGGITLDRGGKLQPAFTAKMFATSGVQPFFEHPNNLRETLLAICGAEVRRGVEVTGLLREGGRICGASTRDVTSGATAEVTADLTIGDDGANSIVRAACGLTCELHPFPLDFLAGGLRWPAEWPADTVRALIPRTRLPADFIAFGLMPMPDGQAACVGIQRAGESDDGLPEAFATLMAGAVDAPASLAACGFPSGFRRIGRVFGRAKSYGVPGAVLIGDAIHPVSPAGGQGANMAIGDAACLAQHILHGTPDPAAALLRERRHAHERGLRPTRIASRAFRLARIPGAGAVIGGAISLVLASESLRLRALRSLGA